jgi:dTDP-4-amino-4,6-dideoxygalactose transaminase
MLMDSGSSPRFVSRMKWHCGRSHAIPVHSGTEALIFALRALKNRRPVDIPRVLVPTVSFIATLNAVYEAGCRPVFCDIDANGLLDLDKIQDPKQIDIVLYVNLYGNILDYEKLQLVTKFFGNDIPIIEDAAQSFGASFKNRPSGSLGTISCLSFDPTKNFNNYGNGGMVLTDDFELALDVGSMHKHGIAGSHIESGTNSRMSEVDCAQMLIKYNYFEKWQERRRDIAAYYDSILSPVVQTMQYDNRITPAYSKYVIHTPRRYTLQNFLATCSIETKLTYEIPLPAYDLNVYSAPHEYPMADEHCKTCLSLPIYPELTDTEVEEVASKICKFLQTEP